MLEQNVTGEFMQVEHTGKSQLLKWVETRLHQTLCPITNTICKKNFQNKKISLFIKETRKVVIVVMT